MKMDYEELTIIGGRFSDAGNFLGICAEKPSDHAPLHIFKEQMLSKGFGNQLELPFFAIGGWKEIVNKPGQIRFTAQAIFSNKDEYIQALNEENSLNN
jgi:hypothetical protein